jgi:hypothetical protein
MRLFFLALLLSPISPKSGEKMCALTPEDFKAAGVANAGKPKANVSDAGASAYCVYTGKSGATGGIEFDVFYPAEPDTFKTATSESSIKLESIKVPGADEAVWAAGPQVGGMPPVATITVRRKNLVFGLSFPPGKNPKEQLLKLTDMVLKRL